jgi:hypothetical protein
VKKSSKDNKKRREREKRNFIIRQLVLKFNKPQQSRWLFDDASWFLVMLIVLNNYIAPFVNRLD